MIALTAAIEGQWRRESRLAIHKYWRRPNEFHFHLLKKGDETAYPKLIAEYWSQKQDFAVIEPDIVIREDVAVEFQTCPEIYCCYPYAWLTNVGPALGCTRFRKELLEEHPDIMSNVLRQGIGWRQTDVVLMRHELARARGIQPHVHLPQVEHLNERKRLLPEAPKEIMMEVPHW